MPSYPINNLTAPDNYTKDSTLYPLPLLDHINIDVVNAGIFWSLAETNALGSDLAGSFQPEVFMLPGSRTLSRPNLVGIKFRAAIKAASLPAGALQAQVTIEAVV